MYNTNKTTVILLLIFVSDLLSGLQYSTLF